MAGLSFQQYQARANSTAFYPHTGEGGHPESVTYAILGLNGEAGEIAEILKKTWRGNDEMRRLTPEETRAILDELGDLLWYVSQLATELGCSLEQVASWNLSKLAARAEYGRDGWSEERKRRELKFADRYGRPDGLTGELLCKRCDVYVGFGATAVVRPPVGVTNSWLKNHCWVCHRSRDEIESAQAPVE